MHSAHLVKIHWMCAECDACDWAWLGYIWSQTVADGRKWSGWKTREWVVVESYSLRLFRYFLTQRDQIYRNLSVVSEMGLMLRNSDFLSCSKEEHWSSSRDIPHMHRTILTLSRIKCILLQKPVNWTVFAILHRHIWMIKLKSMSDMHKMCNFDINQWISGYKLENSRFR